MCGGEVGAIGCKALQALLHLRTPRSAQVRATLNALVKMWMQLAHDGQKDLSQLLVRRDAACYACDSVRLALLEGRGEALLDREA
eukprot:5502185-Prymnesium_polylepis.1